MSEPPKIRSLNAGIADELKLEELEKRLELSPIGILDLLLTDADVGDLSSNGDCESDDNCSRKGNCTNRNNCGSKNNTDHCTIVGTPPPDSCPPNDACGDYGCSTLA